MLYVGNDSEDVSLFFDSNYFFFFFVFWIFSCFLCECIGRTQNAQSILLNVIVQLLDLVFLSI
jgi:hypothetical protein